MTSARTEVRRPGAPAHKPGGTTLSGRRRRGWLFGALALLALLASVALATGIGSVSIGPGQVWTVIAHQLGLGDAAPTPQQHSIVWNIRLPRVLTAALVGAALAVCGAVMQTLTRNDLADPYLLGLSSGAALGAVSVLLLGLSVALPVAAFAGAVLALAATLALSRGSAAGGVGKVVLAGVAVAQIFSAVTSVVIFVTASNDAYREVLSWLMGSLGGSRWSLLLPAVPIVLAGVAVLVAHSRDLDAFAFGDTAAESLGVAAGRTRLVLMLTVAVLTGTAVAVSGAIGFVGLVLPHLVRMIVGVTHARLLVLLVPIGAVFMIWADTAARTAFGAQEIPVGVVTGLVGAPVFALILLRRWQR